MSDIREMGACLRFKCKNREVKCNECLRFSAYDGPTLQGNPTHDHKRATRKTTEGVVDTNGNPIRLSGYQKNAIYANAKQLSRKIKESLCTKSECWNASDHNINKMERKEFPVKGKIESFKRHMKALGAGPEDYNVERMRRR